MKEQSFEEKQACLEAIVAQLETGNVPLAENRMKDTEKENG